MKTLKAATLSFALLFVTTGCDDASDFARSVGDLTADLVCLIFQDDSSTVTCPAAS